MFNQQPSEEELYRKMLPLFESQWLKNCFFADEFRNEWKRILRRNARESQVYPPKEEQNVLKIEHVYEGVEICFHFNQPLMADWFRQDSIAKNRRVFLPIHLSKKSEGLFYHSYSCNYFSEEKEPGIPPEQKDLYVCSMPGFPPSLQVVYGNSRMDALLQGRGRTLPVFMIPVEFVPAFLCSSFEMCAYLFWMDCCIIASNRVKVSDKKLKELLHIFRRPSMLTIKGIL